MNKINSSQGPAIEMLNVFAMQHHYDICRYRFIQVVDNGVYIIMIYVDIDLYRWWIMVFNTTFNNISVITLFYQVSDSSSCEPLVPMSI
jgi:hypothetical protein